MTLSSQLEATAPARVRKSVTVVPPEQHGRHGGRGDHQHHGGGGLRNTLQSLLRSTGNLSASVANAVDETAATFVRTLSYRRRKKKPSTSSQWKSYASMSIDEESASERRDGDDDGLSSGAGSTLSLADDAAYVPGAPRPLRRTLSFVEPGTVGANGPVNGVAMRPRSGSHAGQHSEFRRSVGSLPIEYAALAAHGRRHSRSREHMHSAWSTSLTSLQEDVIADAVLAGSVGSLADGVRRSYDSVFMSTAVDGLRNGLDEVDGAAAEPLRAATDSIEAPILGLRGPPWLLYHRAVSGSLPSVAAHRAPERPCLARSVSTASQPAHHELDKTRSRSLTHIAALDMDAGRPDRLVVPPASDNRHHTLRRQNFTSRSQLSSSEYFFVTFELPGAAEGTPDAPLKDEEYIVAAKGTTLEEALVGACHRRGISLSSVSVFLDRVELSLHAESTVLAGKQLRIRPKQDGKSSRALTRAATSQQPQLRKSSSSVRNNRRFFSTSTEDASFASPQADLLDPEKGKTAKARQRWSLFGNNKDTKMGALSEQLDNFTKYGIPKEHKSTETDERLYHLEDNWRGLLDGSDTLPERLQQQQDAVWELLQTELAYIRTLTVVKDVFLACLSSLQEARILTEVDKGRLFGNIVDIHAANAFFWEQFLAPVVAAARDGRQPLNPSHLLEGFLKFEEIFRPYVQYCVEQAECSKYCRERTADGELFTVYLAWCETHEETHVACNRLQLVDILVMPMQRLTRYSLLLKAILKKTDCEEQSKDLKFMIRKVDDFVNSVNSKLREREDQDKLNAIIARMEPYDVVESKDEDLDKMVKLHSLLDLTRPMPDCPAAQRRYLLQEGDLRLRDLNSSKADVHCFLFTDMLLVCKSKKGESRTARVRVLRPPYLVERLVINELARDQPTLACVYLNEYKVVVSAFLLTSADGKVIKRWAEDIRKAQRLYAQAKEAGATSASTAPPQYHAPPLSLSRQPSSLYDEDLVLQGDDAPEADTHSYASYSLGLYPHHRSPRGSTRGSSLNHSHSGSVEMNEASSLSSVSHSRGISVDNNELRASSLSSDEGIPPLGADQAGAGAGHPGGGGAGPGGGPGGGARGLRRSQHSKSPSPNTLSIQVPVFSNLGQSLPNLNLAASSPHGSLSGPQPPCSLLLVPPTGKGGLHHHHQHHGPLSPGHRGTSYPPPSPPRGSLHRWTPQRNPPLMKMRHVSASVSSQQSCSGPAPPGVTWAAPAASAAAAPAAAAPSGPQPGPGAQQGSPTSTPMPSNFDFDVPLIGGVSPPAGEAAAQQSAQGGGAAGAAAGGAGPGQQPSPTSRQTFMMKRLTRGDNRRYHTAGTIDDVKKAEGRDATIHKRFSWNYGPQSCGKRQSSGHEDGAQGQQDVLLIDRATSPLKPPPQHITDAAWSRVHAGSTERTNSFPEPVQFQSPSVGSSPSVSLCGDCPPCCGPGAGPGPPPAAANVVASVTSSPALSTTSPVQLPSLNTSPTTCPDAGLELASSNPFLEDVVGQDEPLPSTHGFPSDEVLVLITDAQVEYTDA